MPVNAQALGHIFKLGESSDVLSTWRTTGHTLAFPEFARFAWARVEAQYCIVPRDGDLPIGLVQVFNVDWRNQRGELALVLSGDAQNQGWPLEGALLFIDHVFRRLGLRKMYLRLPETNFAKLGSANGKIFFLEGILRDALYRGGDYQDEYICSVRASEWDYGRRLVMEDRWRRPIGSSNASHRPRTESAMPLAAAGPASDD